MAEFTLADALRTANPSNIADALRKVDLAQLLTPIETVVAGDGTDTVVLDPAPLSAACVTAYIPGGGGEYPGSYVVTLGAPMAAGVSNVGVANLSDGNRLIFPGTVGSVAVSYVAGPKTPLAAPFAFSAP